MADKATVWGGEFVKLYDGGDNAYRFGVVQDYHGGTTSTYGVGGSSVYSADASGTVAVTDAPASGKKLVIDALHVSAVTAATLTFQEETSATRIWKMAIGANTNVSLDFRASEVKLSTADKKLNVVAAAAGTINVLAQYHSEA